jgi:hypothetical protein
VVNGYDEEREKEEQIRQTIALSSRADDRDEAEAVAAPALPKRPGFSLETGCLRNLARFFYPIFKSTLYNQRSGQAIDAGFVQRFTPTSGI